MEITPRAAGASAFTVKGINRNPDTGESLPVTIRNTTKDKTVILDGETGKITEAGVNKSADVDSLEPAGTYAGNEQNHIG